ncbi:MAG: DNA methylase [Ruminococcaceae bacterium]|nr:DNA methylase [Oscillospiraceae bacterium]
MENKIYLCIDLKSFFASCECVLRGLDPLCTNLVVADNSRTEKTICLAVSPSLKEFGVSSRPRLFEVVSRVKAVNNQRKSISGSCCGESIDINELRKNPTLSVSYIVAPPRMAHYIEFSRKIYGIYLKYISPDDIHVYSIDEVFIDLTAYLDCYKKTPQEIAMMMIKDVLAETGITATAGIGTNMYLAKIAMDIVAKKAKPDANGVRIAQLDEMSYKKELWEHTPITDFWQIGKGIAKKLANMRIYNMGSIARMSLTTEGEERLFRTFGVNAELIIDHAWGYEPCTFDHLKAYKPESTSISSGQVLHTPYDYKKAGLIVREMTELLVLDLVEKGLVTKQMVLTIGYDIENIGAGLSREVTTDFYGRKIPKHSHGTVNLEYETSSTKLIISEVMDLYNRIIDKALTVRRITIVANNVIPKSEVKERRFVQLDLFSQEKEEREQAMAKENRIQQAIINMRNKYGKNAVIKGMNLEEGATTIDRNKQIGGHKA